MAVVSMEVLQALLRERERAEERLTAALQQRMQEAEADHRDVVDTLAGLSQRVATLEQAHATARATMEGAQRSNLDAKGRIEVGFTVVASIVSFLVALLPLLSHWLGNK